jgi:hypothetical protein
MMKHIKGFQDFVYESVQNDTLYEASYSGRAWSGKIRNIDNLMSWMYDKGILNKGEQAEKDRKFREYYRWYNDGDLPETLLGDDDYPMNGMSDAKVEEYLEKSIEGFIKKVLAKYAGKYDRKDFRIDTLLGDLYTLQNIVGGDKNIEPDPYGLLNYWGKKINVNDSEFEKLLGQLKPLYDAAKKAANDIVNKETKDGVFKDERAYNIPGDNTTIAYQRRRLQELKVWTPDAEKKYEKMIDLMRKMSEILANVIEATKRMKTELGV